MDIRILLVGLRDFLSPEAAAAGRLIGIRFVGPYKVGRLAEDKLDLATVDGVLIDIRCDPRKTFELIEACVSKEIPSLIALHRPPATAAQSAYILSGETSDLQNILAGLLRRNGDSLH